MQGQGMKGFAASKTFRGRTTIRSSGPQPASEGSFAFAASVISAPITAKSPLSSSNMSGQNNAEVHAFIAFAPGPILRMNMLGI